MDANHTQILKDTKALMGLALTETKANGEHLQKTDDAVNTVGKEIVQLNKTAEAILDQEKEHHEVLSGMKENQEVVHKSNSALLKTATTITEVFDKNKETLSTIESLIDAGNTQSKQSNELFLNDLSEKNSEYSENVELVVSQLKTNQDTIKSLDTHEELKELLSNLERLQNAIGTLKEDREAHQTALFKQFENAEANSQTAIDTLSSLNEQTTQLVSTFETAVSRLGNIELKLESFSSADVDASETPIDVDKFNSNQFEDVLVETSDVENDTQVETEGNLPDTDENGGE